MNPEIKAKWMKALRSGEYKQGRNYLRDRANSYCCLGVLCDLYSKELSVPWGFEDGDYFYLKSRGLLPKEVMDWAGLDSKVPLVAGDLLSVRNDSGESFEEIADLIDRFL